MKNFRAFETAINFYRISNQISLKGDAKDQLKRASRSIALNLAEGRGRATRKDQRKFFHIALGSLRECQALLILENLENHQAYRILDKLGA